MAADRRPVGQCGRAGMSSQSRQSSCMASRLRYKAALLSGAALCGVAAGAGSFLLATVVQVGLGLVSFNAIVLYWRGPVMAGALFGGICGIILALRGMSWAWAGAGGALAGAAIALVSLARLAGAGVFERSPGSLAHTLSGIPIGIAGAAGAAVATKGMTDWLGAAESRGSEAILNRAFVGTAGLIAAIVLFISGSVYYAQTLAPKRMCVKFAQAFVTRNENEMLNKLACGFESNLTPQDAKLMLSRLGPYLPTAGRPILEDSFETPRGMPEYQFRIVGGHFPVKPIQRGPKVGTFRVRALRVGPVDWRVAPVALPVSTYVAGLYGPEAGKHWLHFLREGTTH